MMSEMKLRRDWLCEVRADLHGVRQICGWTCIENVHNPHVVNSPTPEWNPRSHLSNNQCLKLQLSHEIPQALSPSWCAAGNMLMAGVLG
jgi:hypothetical protein